jgi:hypothetical protein
MNHGGVWSIYNLGVPLEINSKKSQFCKFYRNFIEHSAAASPRPWKGPMQVRRSKVYHLSLHCFCHKHTMREKPASKHHLLNKNSKRKNAGWWLTVITVAKINNWAKRMMTTEQSLEEKNCWWNHGGIHPLPPVSQSWISPPWLLHSHQEWLPHWVISIA